jgi:hypothetical protein
MDHLATLVVSTVLQSNGAPAFFQLMKWGPEPMLQTRNPPDFFNYRNHHDSRFKFFFSKCPEKNRPKRISPSFFSR